MAHKTLGKKKKKKERDRFITYLGLLKPYVRLYILTGDLYPGLFGGEAAEVGDLKCQFQHSIN